MRICVKNTLIALCLPCFAMAGSITADYRTIPDGTGASVTLAGTTVTGSNLIVSALYAGYRGLGIEGGGTLGNGSDPSLDVGETMTIDFGRLVTNTTAMINDISPVGNVTFGFTAFNGGINLGTFMIPAATVPEQVYDLLTLDGNQPMTKFTIFVQSPSAPLGLQIQGVSYDPVPEPATGLLCGPFILVGYFLRRLWRRHVAWRTGIGS